ncbi:GntR family transcriptional regulator [Tunturiibacter lichenicola]|uniref:GntR family transcriptional regulator n=1 Tax=Tunturiibacter lichenicola TaxID=2051959 RepID=UPI0021B2900F|nr:GntR family transcriptional regulator [Edaphobacter lichenicola]
MVDRVRGVLLERILNGELAPGFRLTELKLAAELETSQGPVREALRELEALGLVQTEPYKGSRVRQFSEKELEDAYVVRACLEELAGRLATPHLKSSTDALEKLAAQVLKAARKGDAALYTKFDMAFHRTIVEASRNTVLLRSWEGLGFEIRTRIRLVASSIDLVKAQEAHWKVLEAIKTGESRAASKLLYQHVNQFASNQKNSQS